MLVRVETSRVGPARLPSAASWRGSSSFAYRIHWRSGRSGGDDAHLSENAREFVCGKRVIASKSTMISLRALGSDRKGFRLAAKTRVPPAWLRLARAGGHKEA